MDIPELVGSEEIPVRTTQESAEDDEEDPENQKSEQKRSDFPAALFKCEVPISFRIRVDVRNRHETDDDQTGKYNACQPRIKVDKHFLQPKEIPGCLRRIR